MLDLGKRYRVKLAMTLMASAINNDSQCVMLSKDEFDVIGYLQEDNKQMSIVTNMSVDACVANPYKNHACWKIDLLSPKLDMWDECVEVVGDASLVMQEYV